MEFANVVDCRRSVRDYTDKPVAAEDLRAIVEQAGKAASWCNSQPWRVYAVTGETLEAIRGEFGKRMAAEEEPVMEFEGVHREALTELSAGNMGAFFGQVQGTFNEDNPMFTQVLFGAPCVLILTVPKDASQYVMFDTGAFSEQLMLAAADRGIGSIVAAAFVNYADVLRDKLPIPADEAIVVGIGLGYASDAPTNQFATTRMSVDDYLTIVE